MKSDEYINECSECGAAQPNDISCWDQFCTVLGWEWQDPELQAQHFLTVASYNLQHPSKFTDEAIDGLQKSFKKHLKNGLPVSAIREQASRAAAGNKSVLKKKEDRNPVFREWKMTISDVYMSNQPEGAAKRVQRWADSILKELSNHGI